MSGVRVGRRPEKQGKEPDKALARAWRTVEGPHTAEGPPGAPRWDHRGRRGPALTSVLQPQAPRAPAPTLELTTVTAWHLPAAALDHRDSYPRVPPPTSTNWPPPVLSSSFGTGKAVLTWAVTTGHRHSLQPVVPVLNSSSQIFR